MDKTPKLPRKSLTLSSRLRSRSSASPGSHITNCPSSPISSECGLECTPPNRKYIFNLPYSPTNDLDFSPRSSLSQSSTNSPEVTWRWTQDDPPNDKSSALAKSTPNSSLVKELRKKRSVERKEEIRRTEVEKRRANKTKREIALKQQCEQMELLISKKSDLILSVKKEVSLPTSKDRLLSNSSGYGSISNIGSAIDLLNDSESDVLLIEATQQVETNIQKTKNICTKELEESFVENEKEKRSVSEYLHDSLDDWFASLDADLLTAQPKKPRTSLQRYKSMPSDSPAAAPKSDTSKIKRYPSSSILPPKSSSAEADEVDIYALLKGKLEENRNKVRLGQVECFQRRSPRVRKPK